MALGIQTGGGGGDFLPVLKYNAKAGRLFRVDRVDQGGEWVTDEVDITQDGKFVMDLDHIETGWMLFSAGMAPDIRTVLIGQDAGQRPSDKHKMGFRVMVKLGPNCGGDVREFTASAASVIDAMNTLHDAYLAEREEGKLPVVRIARVVAEKSKHGTNYAPVFEIVQWVPRPKDLVYAPRAGSRPAAGAGNSAPAQQQPAPSTGSRQVDPPQQKQPEREMAEDFG
ncbi:MAG: hypothetical protein LCH88_09090 [Proteobacteria bacterium]|nr:hypothetical protein [Pseudomonadota bacterium]